jgi:hypothetical protein
MRRRTMQLNEIGDPPVLAETDEGMDHEHHYGAKVLKCMKCGGKHFEVAKGDWLTLVQCVNCKVPTCIHSG